MNIISFRKIKFFSAKEIENTGADIRDVKFELILKLDNFRKILNKKVTLLKNGLTTGVHSSREHRDGRAVDIYIHEKQLNVQKIHNTALQTGFRGVGFYRNLETGIVSIHLDIGKKYRGWYGIKKRITDKWKYLQLIRDI